MAPFQEKRVSFQKTIGPVFHSFRKSLSTQKKQKNEEGLSMGWKKQVKQNVQQQKTFYPYHSETQLAGKR